MKGMVAKYLATPRGQEMIHRYLSSPEGQEMIHRYLSSPEGQEMIRDYLATPDGQRTAQLLLPHMLDALNLPEDVKEKIRIAILENGVFLHRGDRD